MRKLVSIIISLVILIAATPVGIVLASDISDAIYYATIRATNSSTLAEDVSANVSINTSDWIASGIINSTANNVAIRNSTGADTAFQLGVNSTYPAVVWFDSVPAYGNIDYTLYTNATGGKIRYFPGDAGMSVPDDSFGGVDELGDNFTISVKGWIDTDNGTNSSIANKPGGMRLFPSPTVSGNITAEIYGSSNWSGVYQGSFAEGAYVEKTFALSYVSDIRARFYEDGYSTNPLYVFEYQIWDYYGNEWTVPTTGNGTSWLAVPNSYDNNTSTSANYSMTNATWTNYLNLSFSPVYSNKVRIWATMAEGTNRAVDLDANIVSVAASVTATEVTSGNHTMSLIATSPLVSTNQTSVTTALSICTSLVANPGAGQYFPVSIIPANTAITSVRLFLDKVGTPTGTANVTVRDNNYTVLGYVGSIDTSTISYTDATPYDFTNPVYIPTGTTAIIVALEYNLGSGANNPRLWFNSTDNYSGADSYMVRSDSNSYTSYSTYAPKDIAFVIEYGNSLRIEIDGNIEELIAFNDTVPDTSANWTFFENMGGYWESVNMTVGGNLVASWEPLWEYAETFTDSVNSIVATPSFRTTSSDADVSASLITFAPIEIAVVSENVSTTWPSMMADPPDEPSTAYSENATPGIFFQPLVHTMAHFGADKWDGIDAATLEALFWYNWAFSIILFVSVFVYYFFASNAKEALFIKVFATMGIMIFFALPGLNIYGLYVPLYYGFFASGLIMLKKDYGW